MKNKRIFKLYCLRRPDKEDPYEPGNWQPFYGGRGKPGREKSHRREAKKLWDGINFPNNNDIKNKIIHKLWEQGLDFIEDVIFVELTHEEACRYEMEFIAAYGRIDLGTGCLANLTNGGEGSVGYIASEEARKRISKGLKGVPKSEDHKDNLRKAKLGKPGTPHTIESIEKCRLAKLGDKNPQWNVPHTEEWKENHSKKMSGDKNPMSRKNMERRFFNLLIFCFETKLKYGITIEAI